jgi:fluoroquinolone resistance protein
MADDAPHHRITGRTLARSNMESAIAAATKQVRLIDCELEGVDLSRLDVSGFVFERCNLIEADLSHVAAAGTRWISCRARKATLRGADLTDAVFQSGDWNNSDWQAVQISGASFAGVKLTGGAFREAKSLGTSFLDCPMQAADLKGLSFRKGKLGRCDMSRADVRGCDFRNAAFDEGSSLAGAMIAEARFTDADLRKVDLGGHGLDSLKTMIGARIGLDQAAAIVMSAGMKVG